MSRYVIPMTNQTIIANSEVVIVRAATAWATRGSVLQILRLGCSQEGTSTSQQLGIRWGLQATAFGTYTATTPVPLMLGGVASGIAGGTSNAAATAGTDCSAISGGTLTVMDTRGFNNLAGFEFIPTPEERIIIGPDLTFALSIIGTPTTLTGWNASITFEEVV